jgi:hypothetical protein
MAAIKKRIAEPAQNQLATNLFAIVAGLFFFVSILKFGDPVILDNAIQPPENAWDAIFESWQIKWGYWMMAPLVLAGLGAIRWRTLRFKWLLALPLAWLGWQFISATQAISPALASLTVGYFSACVVLFYLGYFALKGNRNPWPLWTGLALALCWIIHTGFQQHFGGLEATRRLFYSMNPGAVPLHDPAYLKRMASSRIFATFSNPDSLAGGIELLLPVTLLFLWQITPKLRLIFRLLFVVVLGGAGLACLFWSGSKAGWLVTVIMGIVALGHSIFSPKWKRIFICGILILGFAAMGSRYAGSVEKQKVSVGTRVTYWRAALEIFARHPVLGTGPGTFSVSYAQVKRPEDDFARLCHNDYLEQACDSGLPGFVIYTGMIIGYLIRLYRYRATAGVGFSYYFAVGLGVFGVCLHSLVEYHLYIPALAWPMFFLLGWAMSF